MSKIFWPINSVKKTISNRKVSDTGFIEIVKFGHKYDFNRYVIITNCNVDEVFL